MFRKTMKRSVGMAFPFAEPRQASFWMENTVLPLDLIFVAPDTSPRGITVHNDEAYDLGQGASFYLNATQPPWSAHFQMYDYIVKELPTLVEAQFESASTRWRSIFGHSMGGHGALMIALKNQDRYASVSAFSPILAPSRVPWGIKAFSAYLGEDRSTWGQWDSSELLAQATARLPLRIDQGLDDEFLASQLQTENFKAVCERANYPLTLNLHAGYDHSYYFIASFMEEHIAFHHRAWLR
jgi:S-formylglutathione hydrolase